MHIDVYKRQAGENFAKNLRDALFTHAQKLPMKWHDKNQTGDVYKRQVLFCWVQMGIDINR